ncbi:MAG TPA: hypothetical protein VIS55_08165 [Pseudomonadales bacterium]
MTDCGRARRSLVTRLLGGLTLLALLFPLTVAASELTPEQQRGKEIYFGGSSPSGDPITAYFGKEGLELPGRAATGGSPTWKLQVGLPPVAAAMATTGRAGRRAA